VFCYGKEISPPAQGRDFLFDRSRHEAPDVVPRSTAPPFFTMYRLRLSRMFATLSTMSALYRQHKTSEPFMPVLIVPFLIGVPVVLGGGYLIYHLVH